MINYIGTHGTSFKGLMAYLLHDKDQAPTSERVAWTETHNLATADPEQAWRIMLSTAMCQQELKASSGVANTGRKSSKHVAHYSLSWSREHDPDLTREEMIAAAKASMTYLGVYEGEKLGRNKKTGKPVIAKRTQHADDHQAIIVCHDEPDKNPHVHVVINRVHPEHGVMLPDNYEKEKLSAWALDYRKSQGKEDLCPQRIKNAALKAQGIVTSNPRKPYSIYKQEQAIEQAEPGSRRKSQLEQQVRKAQQLKTKHEALKSRQAEQMHALEDRHVAAERAERSKTADAIKQAHGRIQAAYAPQFEALIDRQATEKEAFQEAKGTAAGHVRNAWAAFKTKAWMTEIRTQPLEAMKQGFGLAFSSGLQERDLDKHHVRELSELRGKRTGEERAASLELRTEQGFKLEELRSSFHQDRNDLMLVQGMETAKIKTEWHQLGRDRLASEIEDARGLDREDRSGGGEGKKPRMAEGPSLADEAEGFEPANDNYYDVPIDELREIAKQIKAEEKSQAEPSIEDAFGPVAEEQDNDPDRDLGR